MNKKLNYFLRIVSVISMIPGTGGTIWLKTNFGLLTSIITEAALFRMYAPPPEILSFF
jgi:hypothetical protein